MNKSSTIEADEIFQNSFVYKDDPKRFGLKKLCNLVLVSKRAVGVVLFITENFLEFSSLLEAWPHIL